MTLMHLNCELLELKKDEHIAGKAALDIRKNKFLQNLYGGNPVCIQPPINFYQFRDKSSWSYDTNLDNSDFVSQLEKLGVEILELSKHYGLNIEQMDRYFKEFMEYLKHQRHFNENQPIIYARIKQLLEFAIFYLHNSKHQHQDRSLNRSILKELCHL